MPHKLLIEFDIRFDSEYSPYLKAMEVIRGEVFKLSLSATNLSTTKFPGADITNLSIVFCPQGFAQSKWTPSSKGSCPEIETNKRVVFFSDDATAIDEGTAWIKVKMQSKDGQPIEYYQTPKDLLEERDEWMNRLYVASHENIQIIALLDQIRKGIK